LPKFSGGIDFSTKKREMSGVHRISLSKRVVGCRVNPFVFLKKNHA
jgi:hypothetical protein